MHRALRTQNTFAESSSLMVTIRVPSGVKHTMRTGRMWPGYCLIACPTKAKESTCLGVERLEPAEKDEWDSLIESADEASRPPNKAETGGLADA
jgi:hypothetical protein